jgi:fatty acid desaturase
MEHHLLITVPHYNLKAMHERLTELGVVAPGCVDHSYAAILRRAASKGAGGAAEQPGSFEERGAHTPPPRVPPF